MDEYVERMVKRNDPVYWKAAFVGALVLTVISLFLALQYAFALLLLLAMIAADYGIWLFSSVEYEYTYFGGSFELDEVLNKSRRRKIVETNAEELVLFAPKNSDAAKTEMGNAKILDYSGNGPEDKKYAYIYVRNGNKVCMYIEGNDELVKQVRRNTPQKYKAY
ncbi:hypothetical protein BXO88_05795 [Oribacterium sp. C9]|uniref:DUF6106 family protein n=1 Tax=Oribacterium sp. C9 TaxID=1943579 RepID=UPI00098FA3EE|nr:DUF6106 family protein [Oribacterium sp. C9]OON87046.1 hypothetical protein BXO88_05795 [Oribacterium sp. C9]